MRLTRRHDGWPALAAALCCVVLACGAERSLAASPAVKADQVGYLRTEAKLAMATADAATGPFTVRRASDDAVVFTGVLGGARNDAAHSGDTVRWANFSRLRKSGTYYLQVEGAGASPPFVIADDAFRGAFYDVMRSFYGQRCGTAVDLAPTRPAYSHPACHTADGVFHACSAGRSGAKAATRGWHDAGDYGKYVVNSGITTGALLLAYERYADRLRTVSLDIPESGDGTPDVLDEIRWNRDWMLAMQDADGGVFHKLTRTSFSAFVMPQDDDATRFVVGTGAAPFKSSCATADFAAVMAIAARVYKPFDAGFAATCGAAARKAWTWLTAHPNVTYDNNCGIVTGAYGDADCSDVRLWASAELFRTTGRGPYGSYFVANYGAYSPTVRSDWPQDWQNVRNLAMWSYQASPGARPAVRDAIRRDTVAAADAIVERSQPNPYRHSIRPEEYVWGSNGVVGNYAVLLLVANDVEADRRYFQTALDNLHYLFGRNTHGVRRWVDETASYASNENAINWNAALVYALASTLPARR